MSDETTQTGWLVLPTDMGVTWAALDRAIDNSSRHAKEAIDRGSAVLARIHAEDACHIANLLTTLKQCRIVTVEVEQ